MTLCGRGESALDCCPFDLSMVDNVKGDYASDPSTSHEKDDVDEITASLARIGKSDGGSVIITDPETDPPTETETVTETQTEPAPQFETGDVNRDGRVNIKDCTEIQKSIASLVEFDEEQKKLADYDGDTRVTSKDCTAIQKVIAGIE